MLCKFISPRHWLTCKLSDWSFFMGRGGGGFWAGHLKIFELKGRGGPSQKLKAEEDFYR